MDTSVITPALMQAANACVEAAPWRALADTDAFLVGYPDGRVGYVFVDQNPEGLPFMVLYMQGNALASYQRMLRLAAQADRYRFLASLTRLESLECSFAPAAQLDAADLQTLAAHGITPDEAHLYPVFRAERLFEHTGPLRSAEEATQLQAALEALACIGKRFQQASGDALQRVLYDAIGFGNPDTVPLLTATPLAPDGFIWSSARVPEDNRVALSAPSLADSDTQDKLRASPVSGKPMFCELFAMPSDDDAMYLPVGLVLYCLEPMYVKSPVVERFEQEQDHLISRLAHYLLVANAKPCELVVRDDLTYLFLMPFAQEAGIPLRLQEDIPDLVTFFEALFGEGTPDGSA